MAISLKVPVVAPLFQIFIKNLFLVFVMDRKMLCDLLGVKEGFELDELKRAYRQRAFQYHPDRNNSSRESHEMFVKLGQAYEVLSQNYKSNHFKWHDVDDSELGEKVRVYSKQYADISEALYILEKELGPGAKEIIVYGGHSPAKSRQTVAMFKSISELTEEEYQQTYQKRLEDFLNGG